MAFSYQPFGYGQLQQQYYQPQQQYSLPTYQQPQIQPQAQMQQNQPSLYGKIVDGVELVKGTEVPIGTTGIFPRADGEFVYSKTWLADGTTKIEEYKKVVSKEEKENTKDINEALTDIYDSLNSLTKKIDGLSKSSSTTSKIRKKAGEEDE